MWRGWVNTDRASEYVDYIARTGPAEYRQTPGNLGAEMWTRDLGDGRSEVTTLSWWESLDDIRGSAATTSTGLCSTRRTTSTLSTARPR
jgi:heme-degrading monooxygenase HmoA